MGLNRTAMRLVSVAALLDGDRAPYKTLALDKVFDSRLDRLEDLLREEECSTVVIYTDGDNGKFQGQYIRNMTHDTDLLIELSVTGAFKREGKDEDGQPYTEVVVIPLDLDAIREATLDALEYQVRQALIDPQNPWSALWQKVCGRIVSWDSDRYADAKGKLKYATRLITIKCVPPDICMPMPLPPGVPVPPPSIPSPLKEVIDMILADSPVGSDLRRQAEQIAAMLTATRALAGANVEPTEPLKGVAITIPDPTIPVGEEAPTT